MASQQWEPLAGWRLVFQTMLGGGGSTVTARIRGECHELVLTIEAPAGAEFRLDVLEEASRASAKPVPLKRLSVDAVAKGETVVRIRGQVTKRG